MQIGFYFDQTRCTGCFACIVACKDWNNIEAGPARWMRVNTIEKGKYPDIFVAFLATPCYHCLKPACISNCPVNAISKREADGVVLVNQEVCLGKSCSICFNECPYKAPQFGVEDDAKMEKCNLCGDRLSKNKKPACVDACPMRAMDAGPIEELIAKYGDIRDTTGFIYAEELGPSVTFKPKPEPQI